MASVVNCGQCRLPIDEGTTAYFIHKRDSSLHPLHLACMDKVVLQTPFVCPTPNCLHTYTHIAFRDPLNQILAITPFGMAAQRGDTLFMRRLIKNELFYFENRGTALALAAAGGHTETVLFLLSKGYIHRDDIDAAMTVAQANQHKHLLPLLNKSKDLVWPLKV